MKRPTAKPTMLRIIRDCRDATRDYFLPALEAKRLYDLGILAFDLTNSCYCEKKEQQL